MVEGWIVWSFENAVVILRTRSEFQGQGSGVGLRRGIGGLMGVVDMTVKEVFSGQLFLLSWVNYFLHLYPKSINS